MASTEAEGPVLGRNIVGEETVLEGIVVAADLDEVKVRTEYVVRFDFWQRSQHLIMLVSIFVLVFTGMPQKFAQWDVSVWFMGIMGGIGNVRPIHRMAGIALAMVSLYHLGYLLISMVFLGRPFPVAMIPTPRDIMDFLQDMRYFLGLSEQKAKPGRFSFIEKFDYLAVFWGMPVMVLSGLILMFPVITSKILPGVVLPVAAIAHSDEAVLAMGWLFIVHFFNAHLAPTVFPFSTVIFTGRISKEHLKHEHPLEFAKMVRAGVIIDADDGKLAKKDVQRNGNNMQTWGWGKMTLGVFVVWASLLGTVIFFGSVLNMDPTGALIGITLLFLVIGGLIPLFVSQS